MERANRHICTSDAAEAAVDRADAVGSGARDRDREPARDKRHGDRHGDDAGDSPAAQVFTFEDVHFDFDRYSLRPEAVRVLEQAVAAMKGNATLRLTLEGHTCNIGTAEYNLALGERRASAVREYLTSNGIGADRLQIVSYGEERPKHDNAREETRRLNRRAALTVRLQ